MKTTGSADVDPHRGANTIPIASYARILFPTFHFLTRKTRIGAGTVPQFLNAYGASMYVTSGRTHVKAWAPAKLNLFLEVLGRRTDGFHELDTLMLPINLCDTLVAKRTEGASIRLHAEWARRHDFSAHHPDLARCGVGRLPEPKQNIVYRAFKLVYDRHCAKGGASVGVDIHLVKRVPSEAGLGGGSSDAAAALVIANQMWDLHLPLTELEQLAAELGSDVPFFLRSTACLCKGRGEIVTPISFSRTLFFVVVRPPQGLSTAYVFRKTTVSPTPRSSAAIVAALSDGSLDQLGRHLFNRLQRSAIEQSAWISRIASQFDRADVVAHVMTGSGSCYFGLCRSARHASQLAGQLNSQDLGIAFAVRTAKMPSSRRLHEHPGLN